MPKMKNHRLLPCLLGVAMTLTLATACSSSAPPAKHSSPNVGLAFPDTPADTMPPSADTTTSGASPLTTVGTIDYQSAGGYTWSVTVAFGSIRSVSDPSVDQSLVQACNADAATAGFIPMRITAVNTQTQFTEDAAASFRLDTSSGSDGGFPNGVAWTANFASGAQCQDAGTIAGEPWTVTYNQLAPSASSTTNGGLLISNWKSPNYPDGDPSYEHLWLGQANESDRFDVSVVWTVSSVTGPGVVVGANALPYPTNVVSHWFMPISAGA